MLKQIKHVVVKQESNNIWLCGCKTRKQQSTKWLFQHKGHSHGHNVTDLGVI